MKAFWLRTISVGIGIALALALGELALRLYGDPGFPALVAIDPGHRARLEAENREAENLALQGNAFDQFTLYFPTPTGFRMRANTRAVIQNHTTSGLTVEIRTNSLGYRNPELGPKRDTRVLFLGDSITLQDYLPEPDGWVRLLERLSRDSTEPIEAVNAAVSGIGLANELAILAETGIGVDPDVVVVAWYLNDAVSSPGVRLPRLPEPLRWSRIAQRLARALWIWRPELIRTEDALVTDETRARWRAELRADFPQGPGDKRHDPAGFNKFMIEYMEDWPFGWSRSAWEHMRPMFAELKRQSNLHDFELLLVAFPMVDQVSVDYVYDFPQQQLAAIARDLDVPFLDLLPLFREASRRGQEPLFYDWCHPAPAGNALIAPAVLRFIQSRSGEGRS